MSLTVTIEKQEVFGNKRAHLIDIAFDSSYPYGGESLSARNCGLSIIDRIFIEPAKGLAFEFDHDNAKVQVFGPAPPIVWEEQQTIASNAITLNYPAAYIFYIARDGVPIPFTDTGATLASGQAKPTSAFAAGVRSGITFYAGTTGVVFVGYITQAWKEVWDNLIQGETQTTTTHVATLTNQAVAIQSIRAIGTTGSNASLMVDKDDTVATLEADVDMTSTTKTITFKDTDVITSAVVSYIKKPSSGFLTERFVAEEALTAASNVCTTAYPLLLWGYANQLPENGAVTEQMINVKGSAGAGECKFGFLSGSPRLVGHSVTTGTGMYVWGTPDEIPGLVPLELKNGTNLSFLTDVKAWVFGS